MFRLADLAASEIETAENARKHNLKGATLSFPHVVDMLLIIPQVVDRSNPDADLTEQTFYYYSHYLQSHATTACIFSCFEKGYYLEATVLTRHMMEAFVQMRYFKKHPELLVDHITGGRRIRFRPMFEEFSPGFYSNYYGQFWSEAAHGMAYKMIMRAYPKLEPDGGNLVLGNWYNEPAAITIINALAAVVSGYFNYVDQLLPRNLLRTDKSIWSQFLGLQSWLNSALGTLLESGMEPKDLYLHYHKIFS